MHASHELLSASGMSHFTHHESCAGCVNRYHLHTLILCTGSGLFQSKTEAIAGPTSVHGSLTEAEIEKPPEVGLWQNTLLSEMRHTRSVISYCEKKICISLSKMLSLSGKSVQPHRTGNCWLVSVWSREAWWECEVWRAPSVISFQRKCETISPEPTRSLWGERLLWAAGRFSFHHCDSQCGHIFSFIAIVFDSTIVPNFKSKVKWF